MNDTSSKLTRPSKRGRIPPAIAAVSVGLFSTEPTSPMEERTSSKSSISLANPTRGCVTRPPSIMNASKPPIASPVLSDSAR